MRLRMEGSPHGLQEILLKPGLNRLGRTEDNDFQISDNSVSSHHRQIDLKDDVIAGRIPKVFYESCFSRGRCFVWVPST